MPKLIKPLKTRFTQDGRPSSVGPYEKGDAVPVECGGTGATTKQEALKNIGAASVDHVHPRGNETVSRIYEENPSGVYDNWNRDFRTEYAFVQSTVEIYLNGLLQRRGSDNDYILIAPNIVRMNDAPWKGDLLTISYDIVPS